MAGAFINYRRSDASGDAGRLAARLRQCFTRFQVFLDVDGGIGHGDSFPVAIESALNRSSALVVIIGKDWLTCTNQSGERRLTNEKDWVRREIAVALNRGHLVLPVLVDGARMPSAEELPDELQALADRHFAELRSTSWRYDSARIVKALRKKIPLNCLTLFATVVTCVLVSIAIWLYLYYFPPISYVVEKVSGDGLEIRNLEWNDSDKFVIRVRDLHGQPAYGVKVEWRTEFCPDTAYVGTSGKDGLASATNVCSPSRPFGTYTQSAVPVTDDSPVGVTKGKRMRATGRPVLFTFKTP